MNISTAVTGLGGGYLPSSLPLTVHAQQQQMSSFTPNHSFSLSNGSLTIQDVPGNRLYADGKTVQLLSPSLPFVAGKVAQTFVSAVFRSLSENPLLAKVKQATTSAIKAATSAIKGCYNGIQIQHPKINKDSLPIVRTLCENAVKQVALPAIQVLTSDIESCYSSAQARYSKMNTASSAATRALCQNAVKQAETSAIQQIATSATQTATLDIEGCYISILIQYPQMNEASSAVVQALCENNSTTMTIISDQWNPSGVQAIAAGLKRNTALRDLSILNTYVDTTLFATEFTNALEVNHNLQNLTLNLADINPGPIIPSPMTRAGASTLFGKLQCFNLSSLSIDPIDLTANNAEVLLRTFQQYPHFPLKSLGLSWRINSVSLDPQISLVFEGVGHSRCLTTFQPAIYTSLTPDMMVALFQAVKTSLALSSLNLWCVSPYTFNDTQTEIILDAVTANPCFLGYTNIVADRECFDSNLTEAIQNITQGRIPCERDPQCDAFLSNCSSATSEPPPGDTPSSNSPSTNVTETTPFRFGLGAGGVAAITLGLIWYGKRKGWCTRNRPEELEPGAPSAHIPIAIEPLANRASNETLSTFQSTQDLIPQEEGRRGEV